MQMEEVNARLRDFRRALRREDQLVLDRLLKWAKEELQAGVMAADPDPFHSMFLSIMVRQQRELDELKRRLVAVEQHGQDR